MSKYFYGCLFLCLLLMSCQSNDVIKEDTSDEMGVSSMAKYAPNWKQKIQEEGDRNSYEFLLEYAWGTDGRCSIIKYSKIMAEQYEYPKAYFELFHCLVAEEKNRSELYSLKNLNDTKKELALSYLKKSSNLGYEEAIKALEDLEN